MLMQGGDMASGVIPNQGLDEASPVSAAMRAANVLRARILGGELPSGTPLRESALAGSLGISRNTFREALQQLLSEGLVEQALYRGVTVRGMTHDDVRDIFTVRRTLQFRAIELSAYASRQHMDELDRWVTDGEKGALTGDWLAVGTASLRFHLAIVALIGSPLLDRFFEVIMTQLSLALEGRRAEQEFQSHWVPRNREICMLLGGGRRQEALRALSSFMNDSERIVLDIVRASEKARAGSGSAGNMGQAASGLSSANRVVPGGEHGCADTEPMRP